MTKEELARILAAHKAWLNDEPDGIRANLSGADLSGANLSEANLSEANLSGANLGGANLSEANLSEANLSGANLGGANLSRANLSGADLNGSNLSEANLSGASLSWANLGGANLSRANLGKANLSGADLSGANLSEAKGLLRSCNYLDAHFERTPDGYIAYKTFGGQYDPPEKWVIEAGHVLEENVNPNRADVCGCGINVAPLDWVRRKYSGDIWKVLIRWEWLAGVVVPYNTNGKIRCERVELLEVVK